MTHYPRVAISISGVEHEHKPDILRSGFAGCTSCDYAHEPNGVLLLLLVQPRLGRFADQGAVVADHLRGAGLSSLDRDFDVAGGEIVGDEGAVERIAGAGGVDRLGHGIRLEDLDLAVLQGQYVTVAVLQDHDVRAVARIAFQRLLGASSSPLKGRPTSTVRTFSRRVA